MVNRNSKVDSFANSLFFCGYVWSSGRDLVIRVYVKVPEKFMCVRTDARLCICRLFVWSNLNFLHISQCITLPTHSCLALYSFCANLLHSLIMWLIVSSLSPLSLHLLFCFILSILASIWLVLMVLFRAAIRRDSVSLLVSFQVLSCEMFISHLKRPESFFLPIFVS